MSYHRLALKSDAGDLLIIYVSLDDDGRYKVGHVPHLLKAVVASDQTKWYGELTPDGVIEWGEADYRSRTDLFAVPVKKGRIVEVPSFYNEHSPATFSIVAMDKLP